MGGEGKPKGGRLQKSMVDLQWSVQTIVVPSFFKKLQRSQLYLIHFEDNFRANDRFHLFAFAFYFVPFAFHSVPLAENFVRFSFHSIYVPFRVFHLVTFAFFI